MILYYILVMLSSYGIKSDYLSEMSTTILKNLKELEGKSITEMASICNTFPVSIHRYFKKIGYDSYKVFSNRLSTISKEYETRGFSYHVSEDEESDYLNYCSSHKEVLNEIDSVNNYETIKAVCDIIQEKRKLTVVGSPLPEGALYLKMELEYQGIDVNLKLFPHDQLETINKMEDNSVLLVIDSNPVNSILQKLGYCISSEKNITVVTVSAKSRTPFIKSDYLLEIPYSDMYENILATEHLIWKIGTLLKRRRVKTHLEESLIENNEDIECVE